MESFRDLCRILVERPKINYLQGIMGQQMQLWKVEGGLLEDAMGCLLSHFSFFRTSFF